MAPYIGTRVCCERHTARWWCLTRPAFINHSTDIARSVRHKHGTLLGFPLSGNSKPALRLCTTLSARFGEAAPVCAAQRSEFRAVPRLPRPTHPDFAAAAKILQHFPSTQFP